MENRGVDMMLHEESNFCIHFGDATTCKVDPKSPDFKGYCNDFLNEHDLPHVVFQKQVHGSHGISTESLTDEKQGPILFEQDGDFLISARPRSAVGVLTADCLPIVFYEQEHQIVAVAHAGWPGTVDRIAQKVLARMNESAPISPANINVYFGPSARVCCYEVQENFLEKLSGFPYAYEVIERRDGRIFVNIPKLNLLQLFEAGIQKENVVLDYNQCTICNQKFHSYRRNSESPFRQPTIVWLK
jgi:hypothetical protein